MRVTPLPGTPDGETSALAFVSNLDDPDLFTGQGFASDTLTAQVPAGRYWVAGEVDDVSDNPAHTFPARAAITGQPEVTVDKDTTVLLDGASAVPVTAALTGHDTQQVQAGVHEEQVLGGRTAAFDVATFSPDVPLYAQPSGTSSTGTFNAFESFRLETPPGTEAPAAYDLWHPLGGQIPAEPAYVVSPAAAATLARVNDRFYAIDGTSAPMTVQENGLDPAGFIAAQDIGTVTGGTTGTTYLSTEGAIAWNQEIAPAFTLDGADFSGLWVTEVPGFRQYTPGSTQAADWGREPFRPGPYSGTVATTSDCAPAPVTRSRSRIHVELTDLQNLPDGFDCLNLVGDITPWPTVTSRTMSLYSGGHLVGTQSLSDADFPVPATTASYRLTYTDDTSAALPVSTRTSTSWTFRSSPPAGDATARLPLLLVNYQLPLDLTNHQDSDTATLTIAPVAGTPAAAITSARMWTSTDGGRTWVASAIQSLGGGQFSASLPQAASGQAVSLRVTASDADGSGIDQTIITAYHA
jgi:hypothetical protein